LKLDVAIAAHDDRQAAESIRRVTLYGHARALALADERDRLLARGVVGNARAVERSFFACTLRSDGRQLRGPIQAVVLSFLDGAPFVIEVIDEDELDRVLADGRCTKPSGRDLARIDAVHVDARAGRLRLDLPRVHAIDEAALEPRVLA
jgi:hypothetical protein